MFVWEDKELLTMDLLIAKPCYPVAGMAEVQDAHGQKPLMVVAVVAVHLILQKQLRHRDLITS